MKLKFKHVLGKVAHADFYYSPVSATFSHVEIATALQSGWLINEYSPEKEWFQSRVVRINMAVWEENYSIQQVLKAGQKARVKASDMIPILKLDSEILEQMDKVWEQYVAKKGFGAPFLWRSLIQHDISDKLAMLFRDEKTDAIIGFTILRMYHEGNTLCSLQFAWNYDDPSRELGKYSQLLELVDAKDRFVSYLNLCSAYEANCLWKAKYPGFEWWDGEEWRTDRSAFEALCLRDTAAASIADCIVAEKHFDNYKGEANAATA